MSEKAAATNSSPRTTTEQSHLLLKKIGVVLVCGIVLLSMNWETVKNLNPRRGKHDKESLFSTTTTTKRKYILQHTPSLRQSWKQQVSFDARKSSSKSKNHHHHHLTQIFSQARRFPVHLDQFAANIITRDVVYLHIFKNGGTTIRAQTKQDHISLKRVLEELPAAQQAMWFTSVRDPIDHFLSGWAEVGNNLRKARLRQAGLDPENTPFTPSERVPSLLLHADYDTRIQQWLQAVQRALQVGPQYMSRQRGNTTTTAAVVKPKWHKEVHSAPQVNFMLNPQGRIWSQLQIVGDLHDLQPLLQTVFEFPWDSSLGSGRNASSNLFLQTYYPRDILGHLSNETLRQICDFVAMDYYLLDFDLPPACHDMPVEGYTKW